MNNIQINVKNSTGNIVGKLDIGDAEINLVYQIADVREPDKKQSNFSYPFTIPGTKNNNKIFQQIFENGFSSFQYNPNKKLDAQIILNGNDFFKGDLQLNKINKIDNKIVGYEVTIYGKIPSFFDNINDYELKDLIDLSDYNHQYTRTNVIRSWETSIIQNGVSVPFVLGNGYVYPMEWRGQNNPQYWKVEDFKPSIYVKTIFDRIINSQGFTYQSNFLNSNYFRKLIIPYNGDDQIELTDDQVKQLEVWAKYPAPPNRPILKTIGSKTGQVYNDNKLIFTDDTNAPAADIGNHYNPVTGIITIPKNGKWNLTSTARFSSIFTGNSIDNPGTLYSELKLFGGPLEGVYKMVDVDSGVVLASTAFTFNCPQIDGEKHSTPIISEIQSPNVQYTGFLSAGRRFACYLDFRTTGSNYTYKTKRQGFGGAWYQENTEIEIRVETVPLGQSYNPFDAPRLILTLAEKNVSEDDNLDMNWFIPDIKAIDVVNEITKLFNLYWTSTGDKSFRIEPRNDFYNPSDIRDWTYKLDNNETVNIQPLYDLSAKEYNFSYDEDSDYYNEDYTEIYEEVYGSKKLEIENDFIVETVDISSKFSPTPGVQYLTTDKVLPSYVKQENGLMQSYSPKLRILFYGGYIATTSAWNFKNPYTNIVIAPNLLKYPYAGHLDQPYSPNYDLNFAVPKKLYFNWVNMTTNNVFNMFWREHIEEVVDKNSHLLTARVILNDYDLINLDLRCLIQVDNVYYRINKITHNPLTGEAEVELFKAKDYIRKAGSVINIGSNGNGGAGDGTFPKDWVVNWRYEEAASQFTTTPSGFLIEAKWRIPYVRPNFEKINESSIFIPIESTTVLSSQTEGVALYKNALWNKSGQSWGDVKPKASFYPTQNRDVNGNFYSPQSAQKVIGEFNYVDPSAFAVEVKGSNNVIMEGVSNIAITGEGNIIRSGIRNVTVVGDNQTITESDTSYINGVVIKAGQVSKKTSIVKSPSNSTGVDVCVVSGGKNSVMASKIWRG